MITGLGQVALVFKDVAAAVAFYRDTLGVKFLFAAGPQLAFFDCGGVMLMFTRAERPEFDHPNSLVYFNVADIQAAHAALQAKGVTFESAPHVVARLPAYDLWLADFRDPENNLLCLRCEVRKQPRTYPPAAVRAADLERLLRVTAAWTRRPFWSARRDRRRARV